MSFFINKLKEECIECPTQIVETGTYLGEGVKSYLETNQFTKIYSIELSDKYYQLNKTTFQDNTNITILKGDSSDVIENLINTNVLEKTPILFYLDAHFSGGDTAGETVCNGCPVLREVETISKRNVSGDVIFIDDMRLMGKAMWSGTDGDTKYPKTFFDFTHASYENIMKALSPRNTRLIKMCDSIDRLLIVLE